MLCENRFKDTARRVVKEHRVVVERHDLQVGRHRETSTPAAVYHRDLELALRRIGGKDTIVGNTDRVQIGIVVLDCGDYGNEALGRCLAGQTLRGHGCKENGITCASPSNARAIRPRDGLVVPI